MAINRYSYLVEQWAGQTIYTATGPARLFFRAVTDDSNQVFGQRIPSTGAFFDFGIYPIPTAAINAVAGDVYVAISMNGAAVVEIVEMV